MEARGLSRPRSAIVHAILLLMGGLLTAYFGMSANGFLVPAVTMLLTAAILWSGCMRRFFSGVLVVNLMSGLLLVLVLAFGAALGDRKLDVSGVALLLNLLGGGPLLGLLAPSILLGLRERQPLDAWFSRHSNRDARWGGQS